MNDETKQSVNLVNGCYVIKKGDFDIVGDGVTDDTEALQNAVDYVATKTGKPPKEKKKKEKKRPSDFEIARTILQRLSDRKHAYLLRNLGEDSDILFLCSANEDGFTYGSADLSIALVEITDPDLGAALDLTLNKLYGYKAGQDFQGFICLRDQMSELAKTKGESIEGDITVDHRGAAWCTKTDIAGKKKNVSYATSIESLFHVLLVADYCKEYRPLLSSNEPHHHCFPYSHAETETHSILTVPPAGHNHPLAASYPHGFRTMVTKGSDVLIDKGMEDFPYPIQSQDIVVFSGSGTKAQMVHRIQAQGWRMLVVRPNAVYFPTVASPTNPQGIHYL